MVPWLGLDDPFPPVERALGPATGAPGLLAASADLLPSRLLDAYHRGIFPWYSDGQPVLWWSPDPRMVLVPAEFKVSPSLKKTLRRVLREPAWDVRVDQDFPGVMRACAQAPRQGQRGTWIMAEVVDAYSSLFRSTRAAMKRFFNLSSREDRRYEALEALLQDCVVHPAPADLAALLERKPGLVAPFGEKLVSIAGATEEADFRPL